MANWYKGATFPSWDIPLWVGDGSLDPDGLPEDLTGVDITKFTLVFRTGTTDTTGTGTFSIKRLFPAEILYKPSVADVAAPFTGKIYVKALFPPSGTTADEVVYDPLDFTITDW